MPAIAVAAPAKINLSLAITGRRDDGYHLLHSHVVFADIGDRLWLTPAANDSIAAFGEFAGDIPHDKRNLVLQVLAAARAMAPQIGFFRVDLQKSIPVGAGLGGGSANAGAILRVLQNFFSGCFPPDADWKNLAISIGADVPVCVASKSCVMRGIGDIIDPLPNAAIRGVLIYPRLAADTKQVFAAFDGIFSAPEQARQAGYNDLHRAAMAAYPELRAADAALRAVFPNHIIGQSGSGSCFFLLCHEADQARLIQKAAEKFPEFWVRGFRSI